RLLKCEDAKGSMTECSSGGWSRTRGPRGTRIVARAFSALAGSRGARNSDRFGFHSVLREIALAHASCARWRDIRGALAPHLRPPRLLLSRPICSAPAPP